MYYPIIRGRQFELIALRELVEKGLLSDSIIPIIEPIKLSSTLVKTIKVFVEKRRSLILINNPSVGNFDNEKLLKKNEKLYNTFIEILCQENIHEAFYINEKTIDAINKYKARDKKIEDIYTICLNKDFISKYDENDYLKNTRGNLIPDERMFRRRISFNCIMTSDKFNKQNRNTDYENIPDEFFSEDHRYFSEEGYIGFSDYSIIGNEYTESGFAPFAVAIHIVYFDEEKNLRIKHFVSDSNEDISNPAGKFAEAVEKLVAWNQSKGLKTYGMMRFEEMYEKEIYPGLGTVKKLSLMHHLELMSHYLNGEKEYDNM